MSGSATGSVLAGLACGVSGFIAGAAFAFAWRIRVVRRDLARGQAALSEDEAPGVARVEFDPSANEAPSDSVAMAISIKLPPPPPPPTPTPTPTPTMHETLEVDDRTGLTDSQLDALPVHLPIVDPRRRRLARTAKPTMHRL